MTENKDNNWSTLNTVIENLRLETEQKIAELKASLENLNVDKTSLESKYKTLDKEYKLALENAAKQKKTDNSTISELEKKLENEKQTSITQSTNLKTEIENLNQRYQSEIKTILENLSRVQTELEKTSFEKNNLFEQTQKLSVEFNAYKTKKEEDIKVLAGNVQLLHLDFDDITEKYRKLTTENEETKKELKESQELYIKEQQENKELSNKVEECFGLLKLADAANQNLNTNYNKSEADKISGLQKIDNLETEIQEYKSEIDAIKNQLSEEQKKVGEYQLKINDYEASLVSLKDKHEKEVSELESNHKEDILATHAAFAETNKKSREENARLNLKIGRLQTEIEETNTTTLGNNYEQIVGNLSGQITLTSEYLDKIGLEIPPHDLSERIIKGDQSAIEEYNLLIQENKSRVNPSFFRFIKNKADSNPKALTYGLSLAIGTSVVSSLYYTGYYQTLFNLVNSIIK